MIRNCAVVIFAALLAVGLSAVVDKSVKSSKKAFFVNNPSSSDYKLFGKNEEHRYGVELKENNQFHHTTTAEDGVRLGCYGHDQNGKTFSTHYVADNRGYRLVPHDKVIMVYPRGDADPRKASFVSAFNEDEINELSIHYFFPKGCKAPELRQIPPIQKKTDAVEAPSVVITTTTEDIKPTTYRPTTTTSMATTTTKSSSTTKSTIPTTSSEPQTTPSTPPPTTPTTTKESTTINSTTIKLSESDVVTEAFIPLPDFINESSKNEVKSEEPQLAACTTDTCCLESRPKIVLPSKSDSCCQNYSTLHIPIPAEKLAKIPIAEIQSLNNSDDDLILMLIKLIKLVEKCRN